jgi:murein DD-endopeptidase MepM/ murein hydrolase activator NlpD
MPVGATVRAARDGTVVRVVEHFAVGGTEERFKKRANAILILHSDGTIARYLHLQQEGALVEAGDPVHAGDPIGLSGDTGYSQKPHLHFDVFSIDDELERRTLDVRFANGTSAGFVPRSGQSLYGGGSETVVRR